MKTDKELIQIAIDNFSFFTIRDCDGLCNYLEGLLTFYAIDTVEEKKRLRNIIIQNIQERTIFNFWKPNTRSSNKSTYFWKPYTSKPRLKYLKWLLKKYSNEKTSIKQNNN